MKLKSTETGRGNLGYKYFLKNGKFICKEVLSRKVGSNTYYFVGKTQLTVPIFSTKAEAMMAELKRLDQVVFDLLAKVSYVNTERTVLNTYLAQEIGLNKPKRPQKP